MGAIIKRLYVGKISCVAGLQIAFQAARNRRVDSKNDVGDIITPKQSGRQTVEIGITVPNLAEEKISRCLPKEWMADGRVERVPLIIKVGSFGQIPQMRTAEAKAPI